MWQPTACRAMRGRTDEAMAMKRMAVSEVERGKRCATKSECVLQSGERYATKSECVVHGLERGRFAPRGALRVERKECGRVVKVRSLHGKVRVSEDVHGKVSRVG